MKCYFAYFLKETNKKKTCTIPLPACVFEKKKKNSNKKNKRLFYRDLQFEEYIDFYWRDYPSIFKTSKQSCIIDQGRSK